VSKDIDYSGTAGNICRMMSYIPCIFSLSGYRLTNGGYSRTAGLRVEW